jgi:hypothetical protein
MMPLEKFLSAKSFWPSVMSMLQKRIVVKIIKDGHEMEAAPFYLIYQGLSPKTPTSNGLTTNKIHVVPTIETLFYFIPKMIRS